VRSGPKTAEELDSELDAFMGDGGNGSTGGEQKEREQPQNAGGGPDGDVEMA